MELRNRLMMSPMTRSRCPGGLPGADVIEYYRQRAAGGTGLVMTEGIGIDHPAAVDHTWIPRLDGAESVRAWRAVTDAVHAEGGLIGAQLWHVGPLWGTMIGFDRENKDSLKAVRPMRPSGLWGQPGVTTYPEKLVERWSEPVDPMSDDEISEVLEAYRRSAAWAREAGFDAVEVHGGHGYLPDAFLWESTNHRQDRWGGPLEARVRFPAAVVEAVREGAGELAVFYRFSQHTQQDYASRKAHNPAELEVIVRALAEAGADAIDVSSRRMTEPAFPDADDYPERTLAGWVRALSGLPTVAVGGFGMSTTQRENRSGAPSLPAWETIPAAAALVADGECDVVAVGRGHLADPALATTLGEGREMMVFDRERDEFTFH